MTGPEHYDAGQQLTEYAESLRQSLPPLADSMGSNERAHAAGCAEITLVLQEARAHFAAAQVAATLVASEAGYTRHRIEQWGNALGPERPTPDANDPWSSPPATV